MVNIKLITICFAAGSTSSKFGAAVGIPVNFTYKSMEDLEQDDIMVYFFIV